MNTKIIQIKLATLPNVTNDIIANFIEDALSSWGGQYHPNDPLFHSLDIEHIKIKNTKYTYK